MYLKANWETKTDMAIKKRIVRNKIEDLKRRQATDLIARRSRLAQLLAYEDQMYEQEFVSKIETKEQVRAKMAERLGDLKA